MKYRSEIDGLRALAVLPVILFHAGFEWFDGGFVGVDIFFVISGYLITTIIISEMAEGKFSLVNFYERRARRILPALFFVIVALLINTKFEPCWYSCQLSSFTLTSPSNQSNQYSKISDTTNTTMTEKMVCLFGRINIICEKNKDIQ